MKYDYNLDKPRLLLHQIEIFFFLLIFSEYESLSLSPAGAAGGVAGGEPTLLHLSADVRGGSEDGLALGTGAVAAEDGHRRV